MAHLLISEFCGSNHVTRADGARLRGEVEAHWNDAEPLVLDFSELRIASVSFFDESLGLLAAKHPVEELAAKVKVINIDPQDRSLLNSIVSSRAKERRAS